ncbi:FRPD3 protein, partial [Amia calva]|nr:FRPD3 protein [Amia calva]
MDSASLTPGTARQVSLQRHPSHGFGFVAGSERPVIVRSVSPGGPSEGKLLPGDQILCINEEPMSDAPRERVIDLVRSCKESIVLTVLQPHQSPKSAFISAAKKARLRTNPPKVRFSEQVSVSDPDTVCSPGAAEHWGTPAGLQVFLENGQIKSFTFDSRTTVRDVMSSLQDRLSLRYIEHFALVLESGGLDQNHRLHLLQETQPLSQVVQRTYFQGMKCLFRISFFPKDPADLLRRDPAAFEYLYIQSRNDVIKERFGSDWKSDITLKLAALHIYITVSAARPNQKISLKHVEKEWGLEPFLPLTLLPTVKEKNVCKSLSQLLKTYQHPPPSGNKDEKQSATTLLVGPRHGISHVIDLKTHLTTVLAEFSRVAKIQLFRETQGVARVEVGILEGKPLVLLMEWPDATNFACLISGYYKLFVDPKKNIFCRTPGQSHMIKADYRSAHAVPRPVPSAPSSSRHGEEAAVREGLPGDSGQRSAGHSDPLGFCYLHMKEQHQQHQDEHMDINKNLISREESRPRTKSDPTSKSSESLAVPESPSLVRAAMGVGGRARAYTLEPGQNPGRFFCDSCKARMKAAAAGAVGTSNGSSPQLQVPRQRCTQSCASREGGAVDLISLPPPGSDEDEEEEGEGGAIQPPPPAIAAPPPGFRDNSSDEDDPKRRAAAAAAAVAGATGPLPMQRRLPPEEVPVTLIDNVATRTVRDHAQELDDALVSTLQALEALAASEDYPHHHQQPPQTAGLIVLAAITPESSLDSGHETNSSELNDMSEMMSAMKQHQSQAYLLAHHINKERIFSRCDFPLAISGCTTQALGGAAFSVGQLCTSCPPKPLVLTKSTPLKVSPGQETPTSTGEQGRNQDLSQSPQNPGKLDLSVASTPGALCDSGASPSQASGDLKHASQEQRSQASMDLKVLSNAEGKLSPTPPTEAKGKVSGTTSPEITSKALPILLPVDSAISAKIRQTNTCQDAEAASRKTNKPSSSKGMLPTGELFCTCPVQPEPGAPLRLKDHQAQKVVVFHSSSPTDDERLRAKAKGLYLATSKESAVRGTGTEPGHKPGLLGPPKYSALNPEKSERKEKPEIKADSGHSKNPSETPKCLKTAISRVESTQAAGSGDTTTAAIAAAAASAAATNPAADAAECKKLSVMKPRPQRSAPFLSFRNLLSATFPARLRRETDERQAQLQKVRQYELEFLEELLKPKTAQVEFLPQGASPIPAGTPCPCQLRTSPVQKVPGISREQRRSCDCKRICRGIRLPDTPIGTALERRGRERTVNKPIPVPAIPKPPQQQEDLSRPQTLEIKTTRIRSTSLESREPREQPISCLPTCTSRSECMGAPQYKKLLRRYSISEADSNERVPLYAEVKPTKTKSLEKGMERARTAASKQPTPVEPSYAQLGEGKRKAVFSIQSEAARELELLREGQVGVGEGVVGLPGEEEDGREKCCSFCFCYRKCEVMDESSEKDELSYSIPLQVLPGMQLDANTVPVVSKTLQVLDADGCSGEEEPQSQEIDLRSSGTLEGSLSRVQALQGKTFSLPDGFLSAQLDANELLAILRQCASSPQPEDDPRLLAPRLVEYKKELALRFKEFRASCRRVAGVEKSPTRMLSAVTSSFQVLCALTQTFIRLVRGVRSEAQRLELLRKVEEVALNYTFLLRAAEESMGRSSSLPTKTSSAVTPPPAPGGTMAGSLTRSVKILIAK